MLAILLAWGVGFITGQDGSNYTREDRYQPYRYAPSNEQESEAALADKTKPVEYRRPCRDPNGDNESDLCAQWKAARAAETGALWTERAFWVGIIGAIGIVAALLLTVDSNSIARDTARKQLRAYLDFDGVSFLPFVESGEPDKISTGVTVTIKNYGQTPASQVSAVRSLFMRVNDKAWVPLQTSAAEPDEFGSIAPNDDGGFNSTFDIPAMLVAAMADGLATFKISIQAEYTDIFDERQALACDFTNTRNLSEKFNFVIGTRKHT